MTAGPCEECGKRAGTFIFGDGSVRTLCTPHVEATSCDRCGWPLSYGCKPGDCSQRPLPPSIFEQIRTIQSGCPKCEGFLTVRQDTFTSAHWVVYCGTCRNFVSSHGSAAEAQDECDRLNLDACE